LKILAEIRERFGLRIITEAIDHESLELVEDTPTLSDRRAQHA